MAKLLEDRFPEVAGTLPEEPALQAAEIRRSAARPTTDLSAYDLYLRALAAFNQFARERVLEALGLLEQAIAPRMGRKKPGPGDGPRLLIEEVGFASDSPLEEAVTSELVSEAKIPC